MTQTSIWFEREPLKEFAERLKLFKHLGPTGIVANDPYAGIETAHAVIAGGLDYNAPVFARAPNLLVVARTGIGYEKVDVVAATEYGVAVCNAPSGPTISTAEFAVSLIFSVAKNLKSIEVEMRHGLKTGTKSSFYKDYEGVELFGKQLGLIGFGRIGQHVARICQSIGMSVCAYDPYADAKLAAEMGVVLLPTLKELLSSSDVVSLHLPLNPETHKIMNAERFAQMKLGAIFINTARGGHVDESALIAAVDSGHLFGVGLDVTDPEPPHPDDAILQHPKIVVTPHIASGTKDSKARIYEITLEQVFMVARGEQPPHLVNPEVWPKVLEKLRQQ
jgi:D-3-phosphoglycerate dehydrogenase / 2-oxoglutarate reductase